MNALRLCLLLVATLVSFINGAHTVHSQIGRDDVLKSYRLDQEESQAIDQSMEEIWSIDLFEQPLTDLVEEIRRRFVIRVQLDIAGLDLAGVTPEDQVTVNLQGVTFRSSLSITLAQLDCTYLVKDNTLFITSMEASGEHLRQKVYNVSHLVRSSIEFDSRRVVKHGNSTRAADRLVENIQQAIAPASWENAGGTGTIQHLLLGDNTTVLAINQTERTHWKIKLFLGALTETLERGGSGRQNSSAAAAGERMATNQITTLVYPINTEAMTPTQALELIETVLGEESLQREKKAFFVKTIGNTLVIRQTRETHADIAHLLIDAAVLQDRPDQERSNPNGGEGGGMSGGGGFF